MYCPADTSTAFIQGTEDDELEGEDTALVSYEIFRCHDGARNKSPLDPKCDPAKGICELTDLPCKSGTDIDTWLKTKMLQLSLINTKINFSSKGEISTFQTLKDLAPIPLTSGVFTESEYRFRKNEFSNYNPWFPIGGSEPFYDQKHQHTHTHQVLAGFNKIAKVTFRLDTHKVVHERAVYSFIDWLGDVGGVGALLKCIFMLFFGDYMEFSQRIESTIND